jgi:hypothetical protein
MSSAEGHDPPQVPHWMHISNLDTPAVRALTSSKKRTFGFDSVVGIVFAVKGHLLFCLMTITVPSLPGVK